MAGSRIIERGRGPEIEGTRITVYTVYEWQQQGSPVEEMVDHLSLTREQVELALSYIEQHRAEVEAGYGRIVSRIRQGNPAWVAALCADSPEELKRRIITRGRRPAKHAPAGR